MKWKWFRRETLSGARHSGAWCCNDFATDILVCAAHITKCECQRVGSRLGTIDRSKEDWWRQLRTLGSWLGDLPKNDNSDPDDCTGDSQALVEGCQEPA